MQGYINKIGEPIFLRQEEVLSLLQPMFPPKPLDIFSPQGGCSEGLDAFRLFLKTEDTISLDYNSICYIASRIGWVSMKDGRRDDPGKMSNYYYCYNVCNERSAPA